MNALRSKPDLVITPITETSVCPLSSTRNLLASYERDGAVLVKTRWGERDARNHGEMLIAVGVTMDELIGGVYRIEKVLGVGGMGLVAAAFDVNLQRRVAIKFVNPWMFVIPETHELFCEEARAMARLSHPNVLAVHAFGAHGETPYIVMEHVDGGTAAEWLSNRPSGTLPTPEEVVLVVEQTCHGVEAIHASGTVHRDLKPSNILIDHEGRIAVADFGLSCLQGPGLAEGVAVGTAAYMAPENAFGSETHFEYARDIYALACITYEMLVGRPPFTGETGLNVLAKHVMETPVPPSLRNPDLGNAYDDVLLKALSKEPSDRHPTVAAFREAFTEAHRAQPEPERILVADDDQDWRDVIVTVLQGRFPNAVIDAFDDGLSALDAFCDQPYSVVLVDLEMPEMNGKRLTESLRAMDGARQTAIVVLTAAGGPAEWRALAAVGVDAFLVKPVDAGDVEVVIRRTFAARRRMRRTLASGVGTGRAVPSS